MPKNALYFENKKEKMPSSGGSTPKPQLTSGGWGSSPIPQQHYPHLLLSQKKNF